MQKNYMFRPLSVMIMAIVFALSILLTACQNGTSTSSTTGSTPSATSSTSSGSGSGTKQTSTMSGSKTPAQKPTVPLISLTMLDQTHGWALTRQSVLKTEDGGKHWTQVEALQLGAVQAEGDFLNVNYAWVAFHGANDPLGTYKIIRTTDGGVSWRIATITLSNADQGQGEIDRPHFIGTLIGWVTIGQAEGMQHSSMTVFHSTDGGATWQQMASSFSPASGLPMSADKNGISFSNEQNGWVTAEYPASQPWLYTTHNAGTTWQRQSITLPPGSDANNATTTPPVFAGQNGIMPVQLFYDSPRFDLYVTHNGGATWTPTTLVRGNADSFSAADLQHVWATQSNGTSIYRTSDGGATWKSLGNTPEMFGELSFVNAQNGWAIGSANNKTPSLFYTNDGGASWHQMSYTIA